MAMTEHDSMFTNVAMTADGDIWWEGMDVPPPDGLIDWRGNRWNQGFRRQGSASEQPLYRADGEIIR